MGPPFKVDDWQTACAEKRQALRASIPKDHLLPPELAQEAADDKLLPSDERILQCGILTPLDVEITSIDDGPLLLGRIASRDYTAVQVTAAFCKRASIAQQTTNCLTEILYDQAMERAWCLDEYLEKEGKPVGSLHGLPVSLKETNTSQSCLMVETINNVFGTTKNPYNLSLSVGGSSGGEACLVAARGSVLASGTDGGGSIRFPSAFCGLWRIPGMGIQCPSDGNESVNAGIGPMARTVATLELWLKAILDTSPWDSDPGCVPMPWNSAASRRPTKKLVIGVLRNDGVVAPTPSVVRAMKQTVRLLQAAGHRVVELPPAEMKDLHRRGTSCVMKSNVQSGGYAVMEHIDASGEPVVPRTATGSPASYLTTQEVFANHLLRADLAARYNDLWQRFGLDAILAPAVAHPASPHGTYVSNSYAGIYNMLDYVTGSVPVGRVDLEADIAPKEWHDRESYARIEEERFPYDWGDKEMKELYKGPHIYKDSPVGVQIVCRRLREEKVVGILKEVASLMARDS